MGYSQSDKDYATFLSTISTASFWTSIILLFFSLGYRTKSATICTIVGYSLLFISIFFFTVNMLLRIINANDPQNTAFRNTMTILPFIISMGTIGYMIYLMQHYLNPISIGEVAPGYYSFSQIFLILTGLQLLAFNYMMGTDGVHKISSLKISQSLSMLIFNTLIVINVITVYLILTYFTTDG